MLRTVEKRSGPHDEIRVIIMDVDNIIRAMCKHTRKRTDTYANTCI